MNAFWFKLFGVSLTSLIVLNLAILAAVLAGIHHLLRISTDRLTATVATLSVMLLFGFSQYVETGNYKLRRSLCARSDARNRPHCRHPDCPLSRRRRASAITVRRRRRMLRPSPTHQTRDVIGCVCGSRCRIQRDDISRTQRAKVSQPKHSGVPDSGCRATAPLLCVLSHAHAGQ